MLKRTKSSLLTVIAAIIVAIFIFMPNEAEAMPSFEEATVTGNEVNMRLRPDTEAPIVLKLKQGTRIGVFEEEVEGWYRIIYGNYRGYISTEYVFLPSTDSIVGNSLEDNVKVLANPITYSKSVATLSAGEGITIKNFLGDWYFIETADGELGYVQKTSIKQSSSTKVADILKEGMSGAAVKKMQTELKKRGFFTGTATGYYGNGYCGGS